MPDRVTQRDVAQQAGVSTATVSYVLSGRRDRKTPLPDETRRRVLDAVRELGYQRNHAARSLRRRRTELVAVVYRPPNNPWIEQLTAQLHDSAAARGYSVVELPIGPDDRAEPALRVLREHYVDGALVMPDHCVPPAELPVLARRGLALVVFDDDAEPDGFDVVRQRKAEACRAVVNHLVERGHRRIAHLAHQHELEHPETSVRYASYRAVLAEHGLPFDESLVVPGADFRTSAYSAATELFARPDRPTALFSATDRGALTAIWAARDLDLEVPGDVAIASVGNTGEAEVLRPSLTTAGIPQLDFTTGIERLYARIDAGHLPGEELSLPWRLIVRQST
ncbi:MAG TPA: LacI family DNA-binding transcriptional regulator [Streptosporangiales bacterium]